MQSQSSFTFLKHTHSLEKGIARFFYLLEANNEQYEFVETISFPTKNIDIINNNLVKTILDNLLLVLGISYWKAFCPRIIKTPTIELTKDQAKFWNTVYTKGLGEFFYKNKIDFRNLINFPYNTVIPSDPPAGGESRNLLHQIPPRASLGRDDNVNNRSLLMFGGGKDSIVSAELLKKAEKDFTLFMVNTSSVQKDSAKLVGHDEIVFKRNLDTKLFELNKLPGTYNGHIPVTAIWEFLGLFACSIYNYSYVIASNEHSSNYGNVMYLGEEINHQWSKSYEFSVLLQLYTKKNISEKIIPFSLLRPLHEIQVVQEFAKYPQYFPYFSSCNTNFKINRHSGTMSGIFDLSRIDSGVANHPQNDNRWCGQCAKCLFVFIMLSAFLDKEKIVSIFGKNLLNSQKLLPIFKELTGRTGNIKPFECVGTPEETQLALYKTHKTDNYNSDVLMQHFINSILPTISDFDKQNQFLLIDRKHSSIPKEFLIV